MAKKDGFGCFIPPSNQLIWLIKGVLEGVFG